MMLMKTKWFAYLTLCVGNRHDSAKRRIYENANGERFVKINGDWIELSWYQNNPNCTVFIDIE